MKEDLAVFKAFSDETRLRILFLLSRRELCVCELVAVLDMPQGKISRHLALLRQAGLVGDRRDGTWIYYSLSKQLTGPLPRLVRYLKSDGDELPRVREDRDRLEALAGQGRICVPNPAYVPATARN